MRLALVLLLLVPLAAASSVTEVRYVAGTGLSNAALFCFDAQENTRSIAPASIGGGCTLPVASDLPITLEAIDDNVGQVRFFYDLRSTQTHLGCAHGFARGPFSLALPPGCDAITMTPEVGSLAGIVRITS